MVLVPKPNQTVTVSQQCFEMLSCFKLLLGWEWAGWPEQLLWAYVAADGFALESAESPLCSPRKGPLSVCMKRQGCNKVSVSDALGIRMGWQYCTLTQCKVIVIVPGLLFWAETFFFKVPCGVLLKTNKSYFTSSIQHFSRYLKLWLVSTIPHIWLCMALWFFKQGCASWHHICVHVCHVFE